MFATPVPPLRAVTRKCGEIRLTGEPRRQGNPAERHGSILRHRNMRVHLMGLLRGCGKIIPVLGDRCSERNMYSLRLWFGLICLVGEGHRSDFIQLRLLPFPLLHRWLLIFSMPPSDPVVPKIVARSLFQTSGLASAGVCASSFRALRLTRALTRFRSHQQKEGPLEGVPGAEAGGQRRWERGLQTNHDPQPINPSSSTQIHHIRDAIS